MPSNNLTQSITEIVGRLKDVKPTKRNDLDEIVLQYRNIFGSKFTAKPDEEIISSDVSKSLHSFLKRNHCCWIDFIGCDSFSCSDKKQLFFATVSMSKRDIGRRKEFLQEYNHLLENHSAIIPVDIFVQLFFKDIERFREELKHKSLVSTLKKDLIDTLTRIQNNGLMISFEPGTITTSSSDIVSIELPCSRPLPRGGKCFNISSFKPTSFDKELIAFLKSIILGTRPTALVCGVAKLNRSLHTDVKYLYFLPMIGSEGAIGLYCYGSKKELTQMQRSDLSILVHNILFPFVSAYKSTWESQQIVKESIKSAVSAIMSRNMSHNLGSHYLYYTKSCLEDLAASSGRIGPDIKGAAEVLSYMQARMDYLATIISNDKYPNGAVNFKSQIYDVLTVDDFSKRHFRNVKDRCKRTTNFLLTNLVLSEKFTRPNIFTSDSLLSENKHYHGDYKSIRLQVKLWNADTNSFDTFTGSSKLRALKRENKVKNELSKLNIALPGGTMSCHAFFNIIENFIRNSAKYLQKDFKDEGLLFTILISRSKSIENAFDFVVYDNKENAEKVLPLVNEQLQNLSIIDENGGIEKSSKGIKEMLFSAVWMRSSLYPEETFADIITRIQTANNGEKKLSLISDYGFDFVAVSDNGSVRKGKISHNDNLGIRFVLPEFCFSRDFNVDSNESEKEIITKALTVSSDIVCFNALPPDNKEHSLKYLSYFTRPFFNLSFNEAGFNDYVEKARVLDTDASLARDVYKFKLILDKRFREETGGNIDTMCLDLGGRLDIKPRPENHGKIIYFERHLSTKKEGFSKVSDYAYADSISGGNFTITLNSIVEDGLDARSCTFKTWFDKLFVLKIKESALTRITLIDERLFNSMISDGPKKEEEYAYKNIRVLNINLDKANSVEWGIGDIIEGNHFRDNNNRSHFLSIHLGLIEKVVKSEWGDIYGKETPLEKKVSLFMEQLASFFAGEAGTVFVSVHSGRGNFSKELEGPLASYPFMSLAAIENAFGNSKYLLAQLFYNTVYIGKGVINK